MKMKIELTTEEVELLKELLSLDMDNIGFDEDEQDTLDDILGKLNK
jgi:hypothetical protein